MVLEEMNSGDSIPIRLPEVDLPWFSGLPVNVTIPRIRSINI